MRSSEVDMNLRLGRSGIKEGTAAASISLSTAGVFAHEAKKLYAGGNMAYYTLPASILISLLIFVLLAKLIKRSGAGNLSELICQSADRPTGIVITLLLFFALIFSAYSPLSQFLKALHGLFFQGASYSRILLYIMAPVLLICFLGFETIARTAKLLAVPLMIVFLSVIVSASSDFEVYRLFPTAGGGLKSILTQIFREVFTFLPAMISLLTVSDGLNGIDSAIRIGAASFLISAAVCAAAQLAVGLVFTYRQLNELFMPLFRINHLNKFEAHLMRMDKLANIVWLNGAVLTASFYLYSASRLFAGAFGLHDIRPAIAASVMLAALMLLFETETVDNTQFVRMSELVFRYGTVTAFPVLASGILSAVRSEGREKCGNS